MKANQSWRLQARKRTRISRWGPKPRQFQGVLRQGRGDQVILDLPRVLGLGFASRPGIRVWFTVLGSELVVTGKPWGQRGKRRYGSRLVRAHLPIKLLLRNRKTVPPPKGKWVKTARWSWEP